MGESTARIDAFTDSAFAFAVSLLVIGGTRAPEDVDSLFATLADIPAFAVGFAIMALFWMGHVRWRRLRGPSIHALPVLLTLFLVFLTLVYVQPLRAMSAATGLWLTGHGSGFRGALADLFAVYGTGFVLMSLTMAALFWEGLRNRSLNLSDRQELSGERGIWLINAATGMISVLVSLTSFGVWAAMMYASLGVTIPLYTHFHDWIGKGNDTPVDGKDSTSDMNV